MTIIQKLQSKIRSLIHDKGTVDNYVEVAGDGRVFTVPQENAYQVNSVLVEGVSIANRYTYDVGSQQVSIANGYVDSGDTVVINHNYYKYSNSELLEYIESVLSFLDTYDYGIHFDLSNDDTDIYPNVLPKEQNLIAILVMVLINPDWVTLRLPNVTKSRDKGKQKEDKVREIIAQAKRSKTGVSGVVQMGVIAQYE